ncbi:type ISP restriction/modification enzyme [Nonomuraea phyllanthi]|uniref:type ISP restriction/modification enzyme n=1 Tax=Nonomuraea phyllanthi TaxID=2219224 RepID=UPI001884AA68|nr:type ISP restriction/modification enzyme [Nonomuraea phyllanthi]
MAKVSGVSQPPFTIAQAISEFGATATRKLRRLNRDAHVRPKPEEQIRDPVSQLLKQIANHMGLDVLTFGEAHLLKSGVIPDFGVDVGDQLVGFLELKAPGRGVPPECRLTKAEERQYKALMDLPNVVYTDGTTWAHYTYGVLDYKATLVGDLRHAGPDLYAESEADLLALIGTFLRWPASQPPSLRVLIRTLAHLCRLMRAEIQELLEAEQHKPVRERHFTKLADEWRMLLFPRLGTKDFADAYAQTVTFALLLACASHVPLENSSLSNIAIKLEKHHRLMGRALLILTDLKRPRQLRAIDTIVNVLTPIEWENLAGANNPYWVIYEDFLESYDPTLKRESGSYYTPDVLARFMVNFTDSVLKNVVKVPSGLASSDVTIIDPAMGTGTFLVEVVRSVADTVRTQLAPDADLSPYLRELYEKRLIGFERQAAPYAVGEMRLQQALQAYNVEVPEKGARCLNNTLDDPHGQLEPSYQFQSALRESQENARRIKASTPVMAVIANPPYLERAHQRDPAPWIVEPGAPHSLDRFRVSNSRRLDYKLHSTWVYFWRWATWKVFDAHAEHPNGVVAFITPSAYLTSKAFAGMRRYLRETADEGWIIDISPEGYESPVSTRLFPTVKQPLCIGIFIRRSTSVKDKAATVYYRALTGDRTDKLNALTLEHCGVEASGWEKCRSDWTDAFVPVSDAWLATPALDDLMPWGHAGVNPNRTWPIAPDRDTLARRWERLITAPAELKKAYLPHKPSSLLTIDARPSGDAAVAGAQTSIREEDTVHPRVEPIAYHSFDRQFIILDRRVVDRERSELWNVASANQIFLTEQHDRQVMEGPGLSFTANVPYVHHFGGRGGCVRPLYRDGHGNNVNIASELLRYLEDRLGVHVAPQDFLGYLASVTSHSGYVTRYKRDLRLPGIRVPFTADTSMWTEATRIGSEVIWLHTYGERCANDWDRPRARPCLELHQRPVLRTASEVSGGMSDRLSYDPQAQAIRLDEYEISPVRSEVWNYRIGEHRVVPTWGEYRCRKPRQNGKASSPLDEIRTSEWTRQFIDDLLDLLNVLGRLVDLESTQNRLLERICSGPLITVQDLELAQVFPVSDESRKPPSVPRPGQAPLPGLETIPEAS